MIKVKINNGESCYTCGKYLISKYGNHTATNKIPWSVFESTEEYEPVKNEYGYVVSYSAKGTSRFLMNHKTLKDSLDYIS